METLDLTKILKGKEGVKLYSPVCGECTFAGIDEDNLDYPIMIKYSPFNNILRFTISGQYVNEKNAECLLFPSKEERTWDNFNRQVKGETYYYVFMYPGNIAKVNSSVDNRSSFDNNNYTNGNYFINKLDALNVKDKINMLFVDNKCNHI